MVETTLITGGARSGKSSYALEISARYEKKWMIATAEPIDEEMRVRIRNHQAERGPEWVTLEEPLDLAGAINQVTDPQACIVIDCLTVWIGNLLHHYKDSKRIEESLSAFGKALINAPLQQIIIITNEVGMGIIPADAMTRQYRDLAGSLNQRIARLADRVIFMVCGIPLNVKVPLGK